MRVSRWLPRSTTRRATHILCLVALISPLGSFAQDLRRTFEVASVKLANGRRGAYLAGGPGSKDPIHFEFMGASMGALLRMAYGVNSYQLSTPSGLPGAHFDIEASISPNIGQVEFEEMLRNRSATLTNRPFGTITGA